MSRTVYAELPENLDEDDVYEIEFTPPQSDFIELEAEYPLFVAGFGSGKSTTKAACAVRDLLDFPGANIACYQPTFDLLALITIPYIAEILEELGHNYRYIGGTKQRFEVEGYGYIICRSLNNPGRIVGYEVFRSHIDELDTLPMDKAEFAWNKIIARNRQKVYKLDDDGNRIENPDWTPDQPLAHKYLLEKNRVSAYSTPEGFMFCYHRWEKDPEDGYVIVRAPTYSNPHLPPDYIPNLRKTYPPELIDAYIEGKFVNLTSGTVYKSFDRTLNACDDVVVGNETLYIGMDFNVVYGASVAHVLRNGEPRAVDEVFNSYDTEAQIKTWNERYPNNPKIVYPDATGKSRSSSNTTASDIQQLKTAGWKVRVKSTNPPIKNRIASMNGAFCSADGSRMYKVNPEKCPNYVNALEQQIYDKNGMPDKQAGHDHILDAPGYYIEYEFGLVKPTASIVSIGGGY